MSAETKKAMQEAIAAHIMDEGEGQFVTEWCLIAATVLPAKPDTNGYWYYDNGIPVHHAEGLLIQAQEYVGNGKSWNGGCSDDDD